MSPAYARLLTRVRIRPWLARIDALTLRERAIVLVLALSGLWGLADVALLNPQGKERKELESLLIQSRTSQAEATALIAQYAALGDPDATARQRLTQARKAMEMRLTQAERMQARLVAPKDMPRVLQGLLANQPGLRITRLKNLPPQAVGAADKTQQDDAALFRHGIVIRVTGDYASLVRYMESLERLPVGFYWERAELDASAHPEIRLTLTLNTLGLERAWLTL
ncbi:MAG: hypothetical protein HZB71_13465 [Betaproteobacteria bacterium]|nr:hypothetical protein [Betaproteobacteria bacterium]